MATTTTNYGWDIPQSTDLVKDGATAIATLGQDIDTSIYTALGGNKSGLVLLNTTSFSGVSSQSISTVFSATYDVYEVITNVSCSAQSIMGFRIRSGATDLSAAEYNFQRFTSRQSTNTGSQSINQTSSRIGEGRSVAQCIFVTKISNPFRTTVTNIQSYNNDYQLNSITDPEVGLIYTNINNTNSYDGFTIIPASGTITGKVSVYGYNL